MADYFKTINKTSI